MAGRMRTALWHFRKSEFVSTKCCTMSENLLYKRWGEGKGKREREGIMELRRVSLRQWISKDLIQGESLKEEKRKGRGGGREVEMCIWTNDVSFEAIFSLGAYSRISSGRFAVTLLITVTIHLV